MPRWLVATAVLLAVAAVAGAVLLLLPEDRATSGVPAVVGLERVVARSRLAAAGLTMEVVDARFSATAPEGEILSQDPRPGTELPEGGRVAVIVSAGSDSFAVPDMIGRPYDSASAALEELGLRVDAVSVPSTEPTDTVVGMVPPPGSPAQAGDHVELSVSSATSLDGLLLPVDLTGLSFVIDPAPTPDGVADVTLEVARRLRALLEASNAEVAVSRSLVDTDTTPARRIATASRIASPTAAVGLRVSTGEESGAFALHQPSDTDTSDTYLQSVLLARAASERLGQTLAMTVPNRPGTDRVLSSVSTPWIVVALGSVDHPGDLARLSEPSFVESVARGLYRTIGDRYGAEEPGEG